jgi:myosin heavy subunit
LHFCTTHALVLVLSFIEKNRDALNVELRTLLTSSDRPFLCCLFGDPTRRAADMPGYLAPPPPSSSPQQDGDGDDDEAAASKEEGGVLAGTAMVTSTVPSSPQGSGHVSTAATYSNKSAGANSVSLKFRDQLEELTATLRATTPHYIKCLKPNNVKAPGAVSQRLMVQQMRYSGVLEVVRIRREAYPSRLTFEELHTVNESFW